VQETIDCLQLAPAGAGGQSMSVARSVLRSVVLGICLFGCLADDPQECEFLLRHLDAEQAKGVGNCVSACLVMQEVWNQRTLATPSPPSPAGGDADIWHWQRVGLARVRHGMAGLRRKRGRGGGRRRGERISRVNGCQDRATPLPLLKRVLAHAVVKAVRPLCVDEEDERDGLAKVVKLQTACADGVHDGCIVYDARRDGESASAEEDVGVRRRAEGIADEKASNVLGVRISQDLVTLVSTMWSMSRSARKSDLS
jgi:hypothetical protein